ncbi:hypothetical protein BSKO_07583 [Bryopsis sp. KO-2023]|nr:hypothetical protein BSKO_07583 [Bryopsis sp. KO-2023]
MQPTRAPSCSQQRPAPHLTTPRAIHSRPDVVRSRRGVFKDVRRSGAAFACRAETGSAAGSSLSPVESPEVDADTEWVSVGVIGPPHGVKGEMKVKPTTDFPGDRLGTPGERWLQAPSMPLRRRAKEKIPVSAHLKKGYAAYYKGHHLWVVALKGVDTREKANALRGHSILIPAHSRDELQEDDFYVQDLVGLRVFKQGETEALGTICDLYDGIGGCDLLKVKMSEDEKRTFLVPFSEQIVPVVDLKGGRIEIDPVDGLLSLADENQKNPPSKRKPRPRSRNRRKQPVPPPAIENATS